MTSGEEFGLPPAVFSTITEIDILLLKGSSINSAFEVATTIDTANKAINDRYRNLFAAIPNLSINTFVIVKDSEFNKAHNMVFSKANIKDGISKKIKIVRISELTPEDFNSLLA
jgi:hypothetical protein